MLGAAPRHPDAVKKMMRVQWFHVWSAIVPLGVAGVVGATLGVIGTVLARPLPYPHPKELALVQAARLDRGGMELSYHQASTVSAVWPGRVALYQETGEPFWVAQRMVVGDRFLVSPGFLGLLGVQPGIGRGFQVTDADHDVSVVSVGLCLALFATRECAGRKFRSGRAALRVVGVLPAYFSFGAQALALPLPVQAFVPSSHYTELASPDSQDLSVIVRLPPGTGEAQADLELARAPGGAPNGKLYVVSLVRAWLGAYRPVLLAALLGGLLLLGLAAANLALLFLLRAGLRERELATRAALGADRGRLLVTLAHDIWVPAAVGCGGGLLLTWAVSVWLRVRLTGVLPRGYELGFNSSGALAAALAVLTMALVSLVGPVIVAVRASGVNIQRRLHGPQSPLAGRLFIGAQMAFVVVLAGTCAAMIHTVRSVVGGNLGFDASHLVSVEFMVQGGGRARRFLDRVRSDLAGLPGVAATAVATHPPMIGDRYGATVQLPGRPPLPNVEYELIGPGYFLALGVPLQSGRPFRLADDAEAQPVAIVNDSFVRAFLGVPTRAAIGTHLKFELPPSSWRTVVGVAGDFRDVGAERSPEPEVFIPVSQSAGYLDTVLVRRSGPSLRLTTMIAARLRALAGGAPSQTSTGALTLRFTTRMQRLLAWLFAALSALALLVAALGAFAFAAEAARRQRRAFAIRAALGATRARLARQSISWFAAPAVGAGLVGLFAAAGVVIVLRSLLFNLWPIDAWILGAAGVVVAVVGLAGALPPALRAARVSPAAELRLE